MFATGYTYALLLLDVHNRLSRDQRGYGMNTFDIERMYITGDSINFGGTIN